MGVASKYRRKITVGSRRFLWFVHEDCEFFPQNVEHINALNILSEDKRFIVRYYLGQTDDENRYIAIIGGEFGGSFEPGPWRRFRCPNWCSNPAVTPRIVREVIEWCLDPAARIEVDYTGVPLVVDG